MIYLDHAASTPLRPEAREVWLRVAAETGNSASLHAAGRWAKQHLELARKQVAALLGARVQNVIFTSGGTEANNLAIAGAAALVEQRRGPRRAVRSAIEHASVRVAVDALAQRGWAVDVLPVGANGVVAPAALEAALQHPAGLVSIMAVNNEMGAIQPWSALAARVRATGAWFHVDAVQAAGHPALSGIQADLVSLSAHKFGGPQGVGALVLRDGLKFPPLLLGGAHERGMRAGTPNTAGIAAMGAAARAFLAQHGGEMVRLAEQKKRLVSGLLQAVPVARMIGDVETTVPHIAMLAFPGIVGEMLLEQLDLAGVCASTGAACTVLGNAPSPVLRALGLDEATIAGSLRLSLGWTTSEAEIEAAIATIAAVANQLASLPPIAR